MFQYFQICFNISGFREHSVIIPYGAFSVREPLEFPIGGAAMAWAVAQEAAEVTVVIKGIAAEGVYINME